MIRKWSNFGGWNSVACEAQEKGDKCTYNFSPKSWMQGNSSEIWEYILDNVKV